MIRLTLSRTIERLAWWLLDQSDRIAPPAEATITQARGFNLDGTDAA